MILTHRTIWDAYYEKLIDTCERNILLGRSRKQIREAKNIEEIFKKQKVKMEKEHPGVRRITS